MKGLVECLLFIYLFNTVESYVVVTSSMASVPDNGILVKIENEYNDKNGFRIKKYLTIVLNQISKTNNRAFTFSYTYMNNESPKYSSIFCDANYNSFNGTPGAILAQAWGAEFSEGSICPLEKSLNRADSVFRISNGNFGSWEPKSDHTVMEIFGKLNRILAIFQIWTDDAWEKKFNNPS